MYYLALLARIFQTKCKDVVQNRMLLFGCSSVLTVVNTRKAKFLADYLKHCNSLCNVFGYMAANELNELQCHVI